MSAPERPFPSSPPAGRSAPADASRELAGSIPSQPLDSQQLLQGRRELQILHQGEIYRLQQTRQGKLILTK